MTVSIPQFYATLTTLWVCIPLHANSEHLSLYYCRFLYCARFSNSSKLSQFVGRHPFYPNGMDDFEDHGGVPSHFGDPMMAGGPMPNLARTHYAERFSRKVFVGGLPPDIDEGVLFILC